jgi:hypothetical protein
MKKYLTALPRPLLLRLCRQWSMNMDRTDAELINELASLARGYGFRVSDFQHRYEWLPR